jgi:hypothetical protein
MMKKFGSPWLIAIGLIVLFVPVSIIVWKVLKYTHGVFIYPYDDTFIHLRIADNLIKGSWGINEKEFASASSSVLYTLILTFSRIFSHSVTVPFVVNCFAGIAAVFALHLWLKKHQVNYVGQIFVIALVIFFTPLPLLIISGMEHTLQCLFSFLFIFYFSDWLSLTKNSLNQKLPFHILLFGVLVSTIRYEGLFLVAIACFLLLTQKKIFQAFFLGFVAVLPVFVFGLISLSKGSYFLPNSVLVKSGSFAYGNPLHFVYEIFFDKLWYARNGMAAMATQRLTIAIPLLYLLFRKYLTSSYFFILIFLFLAVIFQLSFASTGYLYRYEAYLFFCFMVIVPALFYKYGKSILDDLGTTVSKIIAIALAFFLFFPVVLRSITALEKTDRACLNIYEQQYQMAKFSKQFYNQGNIALNDIGAIGYYTKANIVDLWGLASNEVTKSKKHHYWTPYFLDSLCRVKRVDLAIIYDSWFSDSLTGRWKKAATWQIQNNVICGDSIISFYSLNALQKDSLQQQLKTYEAQLPPSVVVKYY